MSDSFCYMPDKALHNLSDKLAQEMEAKALAQGATQDDILLSRTTGFHPLDIKALKSFTQAYKLLLVFRCPKPDARGFIGHLPAKPMVVKEKTNSVGVVTAPVGRRCYEFVSDYDLMSVYTINSGLSKAEKVFFSNKVGNSVIGFTQEAQDICIKLNQRLINKIQHGAQDDWKAGKNRGVNMSSDLYVAVFLGGFNLLGDGYKTQVFYQRYNLDWPYDKSGKFKTS